MTVLCSAVRAFSQHLPVYKDSTQPIEKRVSDLLSRMSPEEKFFQLFMIPGEIPAGEEDRYRGGLFGFQVSAAQRKGASQLLDYNVKDDAATLRAKINGLQHFFVERSRLGIPMIAFDEALHGVVRGGATTYPAAIALAASWDTALMGRVAQSIAGEARQRGIRQVLSPVINIANDPRWGRVEETYGEDPLLTSAMAVAFVSRFERSGIITTPKHFIANVGDGGKDSYPIYYNQRLLDEVYFPPFLACFQQGGSRSVMTAYNAVDGTPASQNEWLLTQKLKKEWGFKGFVISDANAVGGANVLHFTSPDVPTSEQQAVNAGMDVAFQTSFDHAKLFIPHFLDGGIDRARIDDAVSRVLRAKFELGLFDHPYVTEEDIRVWGDTSGNRALARLAARESIVLLKNEGGVLPLKAGVRSIAVIGEDAVAARLGGYSGPGVNKVSILEGIKERAGTNVRVTYARGAGPTDQMWAVVPGDHLFTEKGGSTHGLNAEYFANLTLSGAPAVKRVDADINFQWTLGMPDPSVGHDFYSARWTGVVRAPEEGTYTLGLDGDDGYRLWVDDSLVVDHWLKQSYHTEFLKTELRPGQEYAIRVEFNEPVGNAHLKLVWRKNPEPMVMESTIAAALEADVIVVAVGIHEGEFQDRASLALPEKEEALINLAAGMHKPVVVVLVGGSAITMNNWIDRVPGVLDVWYPGEEGGHAVADVLFGDADPGGRLPISFPISEAQLPWVYNHTPTGRGDDYNNLSGLPLFPFGYGMSYTYFTYSGLTLDKASMGVGDSAVLRCRVTNDGDRDGEEVVQLYLKETVASVARPVIALKGWKRVHLRRGESAAVSWVIGPAVLASLDKELRRGVEPGEYQLLVGASSRDLRLKGLLRVIPK